MKIHGLPLLLALSTTFAFLSAPFPARKTAIIPLAPCLSPARSGVKTPLVESSTGDDVSVPYDAAARLAYDEWREEFNKGDFDPKRYEQFKLNYEALTSANMAAKKQARDAGAGAVDLLTLNEFGDFSAEEYVAMQAVDSQPSSGADIMGKAMEAVESQAEGSNGLGEASEVLAEEEVKLSSQLGFKDVDELEAAIDSMQGIADGGEIEANSLAREARIRLAYMGWCKQYGKESDENRFKVFSDNFLIMVKFAEETGKEMTLNQYADCTEEEFKAAIEADTKEEMEAKKVENDTLKKEVEVNKAAYEEKLAKSKMADVEGKQAENVNQAKAKAAEEAAMKTAKERKEKEVEAKCEEAAKQRALSEEERKKASEEERKKRQASQDKAAAKLAQEAEAAAIAAVNAQQKQEAAQIARRQKIQQQAAEVVRQKEKEWQEKQAFLVKKTQPPAMPWIMPPKNNGKPTSVAIAATNAAPKGVPQAMGSMPSALGFLSYFTTPKTGAKGPPKVPAPKKAPKPAPFARREPAAKILSLSLPPLASKTEPAKKELVAKRASFSLFSQVQKKSVRDPTPIPAPAKAQVELVPAFLFFSPMSKTKVDPDLAPAPGPSQVSKRTPVQPPPSFSLFPPSSKALVAPAPAPKASPVAKKLSPSLFPVAPVTEPKPVTKPEAPGIKSPPVARSAQLFSFGLGKPNAAAEMKPDQKVQLFSIFGAPLKPTAKIEAPYPAPAPKPAPAARKPLLGFTSPNPPSNKAEQVPTATPKMLSFSLFGNTMPTTKVLPATGTKSVSLPFLTKARATLSVFGPGAPPAGKEASAPIRGTIALPQKKMAAKPMPVQMTEVDSVPVLSRWSQNGNGSITGNISNSKVFKSGTRITTSPVRGKATAGSIVKTGSGSQYRLQ